MQILILSCPTLEQELNSILQEHQSTAKVKYLPASLHSDMQNIHPTLQKIIDENKTFNRIVILLSGCGGSTAGLIASTAELVIPKTHDCLDILLSERETCEIKNRDPQGIYMTGSWYKYHMQTLLNADKLIAEIGYGQAAEKLKNIFGKLNKFYIIDTGVFETAEVEKGLASLIKILNGTLKIFPGKCGILHKVAEEKITKDNFYITPKGGITPKIPFKFE